ncbi:MAG: G-D-S-L family lipolytic protein [Chitinophagaceae bacterium]|nr:G-D-S-L family lipolytic protein [Chitinophagaceae bacterium]
MKLKNALFFLISFLFFSVTAKTQPFFEDIQAFKKMDSISMPAKKQILLIGSSSFTIWKDVQTYFPGYSILNRGFGGSSLPDVIRYSDDVIFKYQPKQILIYCGENDFAASDTVSVQTVVNRFKELYLLIRMKYKKVHVAYVSMKPSPSRKHLMLKFDAANKAIQQFLATQKKTAFIDVYHAMLKSDGTAMTDIFLEDELHMNAKGYAIWQQIIQPYLINK